MAKMTFPEAIEVAERWLAHCERVRERSERLQRLASDAKAGRVTPEEARREKRNIDSGPLVHDGAMLEKAVKVLIGRQ